MNLDKNEKNIVKIVDRSGTYLGLSVGDLLVWKSFNWHLNNYQQDSKTFSPFASSQSVSGTRNVTKIRRGDIMMILEIRGHGNFIVCLNNQKKVYVAKRDIIREKVALVGKPVSSGVK